MMFEKVLDEIKEKSFKEQKFELNIDVVKRQYNITLNQKKSLEYVTKLFYPNGVNGIKIIEETEIKNGKKIDLVFETDKDEFDIAIKKLKEEWKYVGRVSPIRASYYEVYEKEGKKCFVQDYTDDTSGEHLILAVNGEYTILAMDSKYEFMILARFLREIAFRYLEDEQYVSFHSSSVLIGTDGYLIIGDSGSGKSTMALTLSKYFGARYVSNDRIMISLKDGKLQAIPYGMPIKINYGTLKTLEVNDEYETWDNMIPMVSKESFFEYKGEHKLNLLPEELEKFLQIKSARKMQIKGIILPFIRGKSKGQGTIREVIERNCYYDNEPVFVEDWLELRTQPRKFEKKEIIDAIMELPVYREEIDLSGFRNSADRIIRNINKGITL